MAGADSASTPRMTPGATLRVRIIVFSPFRRAARFRRRSASLSGERTRPLNCSGYGMPHRRPVQLDPALYVGPHRIFLTMCTFQRARSFIDSMTVDYVRAELLRTGKSYSVEVI